LVTKTLNDSPAFEAILSKIPKEDGAEKSNYEIAKLTTELIKSDNMTLENQAR